MKITRFFKNIFESIFNVIFKLSFILLILINMLFILSPLLLAHYLNSLYWLFGLILTIPYSIFLITYLKE